MTGELILSHEIDGHRIAQRPADGFVDATALCKAAGKKWSHFAGLDSTKEFIQALAESTGIPVDSIVGQRSGRGGGTWVHPDLAVNLAQWLSPRFAVQVSKWVREVMTTGVVTAGGALVSLEARIAAMEAKQADANRLPLALVSHPGPHWTIDLRLIELHPDWNTTRGQRDQVRYYAKKLVELQLHEAIPKFNRDLAFGGSQIALLDRAIEIVKRKAEAAGKVDDYGLFRGRADQVPSKN